MEGFPKPTNKNELTANNNERENNLEQGFTQELTTLGTNTKEIPELLIEQDKGIISPKANEKLTQILKIASVAGIIGGSALALYSGEQGIMDMMKNGANQNIEALVSIFGALPTGMSIAMASSLAYNKLDKLALKVRKSFAA